MDEDTEQLIATALVDLNDRKMDKAEAKATYQRKGDYATNAALALKANTTDVPTLTDYKDAELVTSYALNDLNARMGGLTFVKLSQAEYDALTVKDPNTIYFIGNTLNA